MLLQSWVPENTIPGLRFLTLRQFTGWEKSQLGNPGIMGRELSNHSVKKSCAHSVPGPLLRAGKPENKDRPSSSRCSQ